MKKITGFLSLILGLSMVFASYVPARADGTIPWTGNGSENLPCPEGGHWVLAPAQGVESATLFVNGSSYVMDQKGNGSWAADSGGPLEDPVDAYVSYTGPGDDGNHLQLSHCLGGQITPTSTTPADTATPTSPADTATPTSPADTATPTLPADTATPTLPADTATPTLPVDETATPTLPVDETATPTLPVDETATPTTPPEPEYWCEFATYEKLGDILRVTGSANIKIADKEVTVKQNHNVLASGITDAEGDFSIDLAKPWPTGLVKVYVGSRTSNGCQFTLGGNGEPTKTPPPPGTGFMEPATVLPYAGLRLPGFVLFGFGLLLIVLKRRD